MGPPGLQCRARGIFRRARIGGVPSDRRANLDHHHGDRRHTSRRRNSRAQRVESHNDPIATPAADAPGPRTLSRISCRGRQSVNPRASRLAKGIADIRVPSRRYLSIPLDSAHRRNRHPGHSGDARPRRIGARGDSITSAARDAPGRRSLERLLSGCEQSFRPPAFRLAVSASKRWHGSDGRVRSVSALG